MRGAGQGRLLKVNGWVRVPSHSVVDESFLVCCGRLSLSQFMDPNLIREPGKPEEHGAQNHTCHPEGDF